MAPRNLPIFLTRSFSIGPRCSRMQSRIAHTAPTSHKGRNSQPSAVITLLKKVSIPFLSVVPLGYADGDDDEWYAFPEKTPLQCKHREVVEQAREPSIAGKNELAAK